jgi:hypothetical protein
MFAHAYVVVYVGEICHPTDLAQRQARRQDLVSSVRTFAHSAQLFVLSWTSQPPDEGVRADAQGPERWQSSLRALSAPSQRRSDALSVLSSVTSSSTMCAPICVTRRVETDLDPQHKA